MERLQRILAAQYVMMDKILINCDYIFRHNQEQHKEEPIISNSQYLRYVASLVSDDIIVNLYKLLKETQDHSFQQLNSIVTHIVEQKNFKFKSQEREEYFNNYLETFEELSSLYQAINWEGIRNKYVGHLDKNRPAIKFELEDLKKIQEYLLVIRKSLNKAFYELEMLEHENPLIELIDDNIKLKLLLK